MRPLSFMVVAGETSGDMLAAELVEAIRAEGTANLASDPAMQPLRASLAPRFFGAGGPRMEAAGVQLHCDLTKHAIVGFVEVVKKLRSFAQLYYQLKDLAIERMPDAIVCVDFSGFNRRLAHGIKSHVRSKGGGHFHNWNPKVVQYVSPQVWASRPGRAWKIARDLDLLLSIFPFEKNWYAERVPHLNVEFIGHPLVDRFCAVPRTFGARTAEGDPPLVLLLPGSRTSELKRHLPVIIEAARTMSAKQNIRWRMVLPSTNLADLAATWKAQLNGLDIRIGGLAESLAEADLAIASSGTVTLECAYFGVPTLVMYKISRGSYELARRIVRVPYIAMPNLLANEAVFPEFIQDAATPDVVATEALDLLNNQPRRKAIKGKLWKAIESLGPAGATQRAAKAILALLR